MKLAVGGCSFSDRRYNIKPWGEKVAEHFDAEYIHEAASAGSNYRIWRRLTAHIMNKNIVAGDIVIIQYTNVDRKEYWTPTIHKDTFELESICEPYDKGTLVRLTPHFKEFAKTKAEKHLAQVHNYFNNHKLNLEQFYTQHHGFAALCKIHDITLRFLNTAYDVENRIVDIDGTHLLVDENCCLDLGHMNQLGHDQAAQLVIQYLNPTIVPS